MKKLLSNILVLCMLITFAPLTRAALTVAGTAADGTAILQIDNKTLSARDKTWEITVTTGTVKTGLTTSDVTLTGLPSGLAYTAIKSSGNTIVVTLTGAATTALTADASVSAVIEASAVTEAGAQSSAAIPLNLWYIGEGTTFVITNEFGTEYEGGLIDKLIDAGYGDNCLYDVLVALKPYSGGAITDRFLQTLLSCSAGSEVFDEDAFLGNFAGLNGPICVNADGTLTINSIFGKHYFRYFEDTGYNTSNDRQDGVGMEFFTCAKSAQYYIDAGALNSTTRYKAFAIAWVPNTVATVILSNEAGPEHDGGLIDKLIDAGYGDSSLFEVMQVLQPLSDGAITDEFMAELAACPADSDAKMAELFNFGDESNNPIGIGADGTLIVAGVYGYNYTGENGYSTTVGHHAAAGNAQFTAADSERYYISAGASTYDGSTHYYEVFAIAWASGKSSPWADPWLEKAARYNLIPDCLLGTDMTQPITRAEFAALSVKLYEALCGKAATAVQSNPFADTTDPEILKAVNIGITNGTSPTTFSPRDLITREQAATMLTRAYKAAFWEGWTLAGDASYTAHTLDFSGVAAFADDASISAFAKPSVYFMAKNGIINGVGNNIFAPNTSNIPANAAAYYGQATREAAAKIAVATYENLGNT